MKRQPTSPSGSEAESRDFLTGVAARRGEITFLHPRRRAPALTFRTRSPVTAGKHDDEVRRGSGFHQYGARKVPRARDSEGAAPSNVWPAHPGRDEVALAMRTIVSGGRLGLREYPGLTPHQRVGVVSAVLLDRGVKRPVIQARLAAEGVGDECPTALARGARELMYVLLFQHFTRPVDFKLRWLGRI